MRQSRWVLAARRAYWPLLALVILLTAIVIYAVLPR